MMISSNISAMDKFLNLNSSNVYINTGEPLTDLEIIRQYCTFFNHDIYYQILVLCSILILLEIIYLLSFKFTNFKNKLIYIYENLKTGFEIAVGFFLIIHSFNALIIYDLLNTSELPILKNILHTIVLIIVFIVGIFIYQKYKCNRNIYK